MKTWKANNAAVVNENGDMICMCHNKGHDITHEDMMDNVKLIAAAPEVLEQRNELLAVMKMIRSINLQFGMDSSKRRILRVEEEEWDLLEKVIAKAEG